MRGILCGAVLLLAFAGCGAEHASEAGAAASQITISDDEIDSYIEWWREEMAMGRRRVEEMNELSERLNSKYSLADLHKIQEDPELLAMMERHREEGLEHRRNKPISEEKAGGFDSVLAGLGRSLNRDGRTVYEVHHDDSALKGARHKYGDKFVDKVLSRGDDIAAAMNP
jgi:hypothetical protein